MSTLFTDLDNDAGKVVLPPIEVQPSANSGPMQQGAYLVTDVGVSLAPAMLRWGNRPQWLQGCIGWNGSVAIVPSSSGNVPQGIGIPMNVSGGVSHPSVGSAGLLDSSRRTQVQANAATPAAAELWSIATVVWRGNGTLRGGFYLASRFSLQIDTASGGAAQFAFVGLQTSTNGISTTTPGGLQNIIGLGADAGDAEFKIFSNDTTTGSRSVTALNSNYAPDGVTSSRLLQLELFCPPNGSIISFRVMRLDAPTIAPAVGTVSTRLPVATTFLAFHAYVNRPNTTGGVPALQHVRTYIECDV
jgi:hypothetical protein